MTYIVQMLPYRSAHERDRQEYTDHVGSVVKGLLTEASYSRMTQGSGFAL